eukprot:TRINITY_DN15466_c0_g1_i1.p1 TRINITY_DN15466_c0_g1~~TRINITY_DN15466_c0_g1_i1.p1  ORF type:complete len:106 (+),score=18.72 TRINITY_DN15466_c0_g1_i1:45-362(+)
MKHSILLLVLCSFLQQSLQQGDSREPGSWTRGLRSAGGRQGGARRHGRNGQNIEQLPSLTGLDRKDRDQAGKRSGYGYTRGSKEYDGRHQPANLRGSGQSGRARN